MQTHDPAQPNKNRLPRLLFYIGSAAFLCLVFLLLLAANMQKEMNHDEHMYVSGGALLAEKLRLPYRDFPYLQMPNLAFIYAGLFALLKWPGYLLLEARLFSTLCATGSLGLIFAISASAMRGAPYGLRFLLAGGSVFAIMSNPVFRYGSGQAWNHDASVFLALLAFTGLCYSARRGFPLPWTLGSGALLGLAVGTRLTFALVVPVFLAAVALYPGQGAWKERLRPLLTFSDGLMLGLLPSLVAFIAAPSQFVFGNLEYHQVNALFWERVGYDRTMDLSGKLDYLRAVLSQPANLVLAVGALSFLAVGIIVGLRHGKSWQFQLLFASAIVPAVLLGALTPTPSWYQYFYALVPFLVLVSAYGAAALYRSARWGLAVFGLLVLLSAAYGQPSYSLRGLTDVAGWVPLQVHNTGLEVARYAGTGKVLTLAPIYPLEGGADIYDLFAVGPFLWRSGSLLPPGERQSLNVPTQDEFLTRLEKDPPAAILTGFEEGLEVLWVEFAQQRGYRRVLLSNGKVLWLQQGSTATPLP